MNHTISNDFSWINTVLLGMTMFSLALITIVGNTIVIYALRTDRHLRTVGNLFISSLATADLIVGCFVMPIAGIYAMMEKWSMGLVLCRIWLSVDYTASTASIFNLLTLSLDRYWSITSPLQYLSKRTRTRALILIGIAWGLSILWVIPIFGWDHFFNNGINEIDPDKCEPGYIHSKAFKVSTAIINFYFPLLVLICLNGRIYYEIKRRCKSVLLQRHSNQTNESSSRKNSRTPMAITIFDNDRQICPTMNNFNENDGAMLSKRLSIQTIDNNNSQLRINIKERKPRATIPLQIPHSQRPSLQHTYSFMDQNHPTQDGLVWFPQNKYSRSSLTPTPTFFCRRCSLVDSMRVLPTGTTPTFFCRRCSLTDSMRISPPIITPPNTPTTMNIFNLCNCCTAEASTITIHSNLGPYSNNSRRISSSSLPSPASRKSNNVFTFNLHGNSNSSNISSRSNSCIDPRISNKTRQSAVWNQQEKAFRQLFAIVSGFTVCFLPYFILYMVVAYCDSCVSEWVITATVWLGYVNSTINPFLYALSNKHFRLTFNRILKRDHRRQSYYN